VTEQDSTADLETADAVEEVAEVAAAEAVVEEVAEVVAAEAVVEEVAQETAEAVAEVVIPAATGKETATGRRKEAIARVRLLPGSGGWQVNGRSLAEYFPDKVHQQTVASPFAITGTTDRFDVVARIDGGGSSGQAGALRLAVARALNDLDTDAFRPELKKAGFLSRDARAKERKKYGLKKARKAPQYSKR
jgi:small subunit ribosomal protein S9